MAPWRERRVESLFPTPFVRAQLDDATLLASVSAQILDAERTLPTVARGEVTGWQSAPNLATWSDETARLVELIAQAMMSAHPENVAEDIELFAWANVLRAGDYFSPHTHANAAWSGVLYVDAGEPDHGGRVSFRDPRAGAGMVIAASNTFDSACTMSVPPETGALLVFPAWLVHWVTPYRGTQPRISVAFNAR